ncbi:MAG: hypothetical protein NWS46_03170, partial [Cyclobacteriaceae bacterium]|nr:hypothetical protein [Cyclobacteriaceae bacterium]
MYRILIFYSIIFMHSLSGFSQITFESGYFITKDEKRVTGFIKNIDWRNSPKKLKFKPSLDSQIQIINIETISEFGFSNTDQYKKYRVKIDRSNNNASNLSSERAPDLHEEFLFLKVLIEGKASLYSYESNGLSRFF